MKTGRERKASDLRGPKRARANSKVSRRGSRRAVFGIIEIDGVAMSDRRPRALRRAARRIKEPRALRKVREAQERLDWLQQSYRSHDGVVRLEMPNVGTPSFLSGENAQEIEIAKYTQQEQPG